VAGGRVTAGSAAGSTVAVVKLVSLLARVLVMVV
jgi:hypothetical protein